MNNECWIEHLQQWQKFLAERSLQVDDVGEKIKINRQSKVLEQIRYAAVLNPSLLVQFIDPTAVPSSKNDTVEYNLELRTCIHSRGCRLSEGFFRQARRIFAGILCVLQENSTQHGGKRPGQTAFEVVNTGSKL